MATDPADLVQPLRDLADILERVPAHDRRKADVGLCGCLECTAELLAARGYPSSTLGSGSRSSDTTSSTERAAGVATGRLPRYVDLDVTLAARLRTLRYTADEVAALVRELRSHERADLSDDPTPAGTGSCVACGEFVRPGTDPDRRLRSGLGPACHSSYMRWQKTHPHSSRSDFIGWRRAQGGSCALTGRAKLHAVPRTERYNDGRPAPQVQRSGWWGWFVLGRDGTPLAGPYSTEAEAAEVREAREDADDCQVGTQWVDAPRMDGAKPA